MPGEENPSMSIQVSDKAGSDEGLALDPQESAPAEQEAPAEVETDESQRQEAASEAPPSAPDDPEIALPDGSKAKASEIAAWKSGHMMQQDYTRKTQELSDARSQFERERQQAEEGFKRVLADPNLYEKLRAERGLRQVLDPFSNSQQWLQVRRQQYEQAGMQVDDYQLRMDLLQRQNEMLMERHTQAQQSLEQQMSQGRAEQEAAQLEKSIGTLLSQPEHQAANTPEGREMIDAFIAREVNRGNESPDVAAIVSRVAKMGQAFIKSYADGKTQVAAKTAPIARGGGVVKAPTKKEYGQELSSFRDMADDRAKRGA